MITLNTTTFASLRTDKMQVIIRIPKAKGMRVIEDGKVRTLTPFDIKRLYKNVNLRSLALGDGEHCCCRF
jgi:hypothetical protein